MKSGIEIITDERNRQLTELGFTPANDNNHNAGQMANAAGVYAHHAAFQSGILEDPSDGFNYGKSGRPDWWPWDVSWFKPSRSRIRNLAKAGALIAAEIDRLNRLAEEEGEDV